VPDYDFITDNLVDIYKNYEMHVELGPLPDPAVPNQQ
jgi:hypothetical protein